VAILYKDNKSASKIRQDRSNIQAGDTYPGDIPYAPQL